MTVCLKGIGLGASWWRAALSLAGIYFCTAAYSQQWELPWQAFFPTSFVQKASINLLSQEAIISKFALGSLQAQGASDQSLGDRGTCQCYLSVSGAGN